MSNDFAATIDGGRVRLSEIVTADKPHRQTDRDDVWTIAVQVKGANGRRYIGAFPTLTAATAWLDRHMAISP